MKPSILYIKGLYSPDPVLVIGGGPSVSEDLPKVMEDLKDKGAAIVSVNQHAFKAGLNPQYMVFMDDPRFRPYLMRYINPEDESAPYYIGPDQVGEWTDYKMDIAHWMNGWSSGLATWLACHITTGPVILLGMDCYQGEKKFFHDDNDTAPIQPTHLMSLKTYLDAWSGAHENCPDPSRIMVCSGPLKEIFNHYKFKTNKNGSSAQ